ncbi:MAG: histidine kinase [Erysipelotrichaceae bacterium]|nr:histidine kinase [Erysipelotrichaceae bacterium]
MNYSHFVYNIEWMNMMSDMNKKENVLKKSVSMLLGLSLCLAAGFSGVSIVHADESEQPKEPGEIPEDYIQIVDPFSTENWTAILYDASNSLLSSEANDIVESKDGFIWIGAYAGLFRYDGLDFTRIRYGNEINTVKSLYIDSKDRMWIGTNDHGLYLMDQNELTHWGPDNSDLMHSYMVRDIVSDNTGNIYVATTEGLVYFDKDLNIKNLGDDRLDREFIHELEYGADGRIYGLTFNGDLFTVKNGILTSYYDHSETGYEQMISSFLPDPDNPGYIYFETKENRFLYGNILNRFHDVKEYDISPLGEVQDFTMVDGRLWICARNGIGVLEGDSFQLLGNVPMNNSVSNMMVDYEGNLWFASTRQGLMKITANPFIDLLARYGIYDTMTNTTCMYEDMLLIGSDTGLLAVTKDSIVDEIPITSAHTAGGEVIEDYEDLFDYLNGVRIRCIMKDSRDRLWISTWRDSGPICYDHGELTAYTVDDGMISDQIRNITELPDGTIVAALSGGVQFIRDGRVVDSYTQKDGITNTEILNVAEGFDGDILAGSDGDGIYIINPDSREVFHIGTREGLDSESIMRIKKDEKRNIIWFVSGNCLGYLDQDYNVHLIHNFPFTNNFDLYENSSGQMWVLSSNGIYVAYADDLLQDPEDLKYLHYSISNGLPGITTANSYSQLMDDGTLYIASNNCVVKVNINEIYDTLGYLKMSVPYVDADNVRIYPDDKGDFIVPASAKKLTIYSYVFNFSLVDPVISYRLEGFDTEYESVNRRDLDPVDYTNLPGGTYYFQLGAHDSAMRESITTSVKIVKEKSMYEQPWFYIAMVLADIILIGCFVWLYGQYNMKKLEKKHKEEAEKQRITTELNMASRLQAGMLPNEFPAFPDHDEFDIYAIMNPAREVGGDFYDYFKIDDDHLGLLIADVSGKGVPGALFMMISMTILKNCAMLGLSPAGILEKTNEMLCSNNKMQMFVSVWVGILEISTGRMVAANAGHEYPALYRNGGSFDLFKDKHGLVLGAMDGVSYTEYELQLDHGDMIFVYTDGVPEAITAKKEAYGTDRMIEALNSTKEKTPKALLESVTRSVDEFVAGNEQFDDVTMLCFKYIGKKNAQAEQQG